MAESERVPLYRCGRGDAVQYGELDLWERSFKENVACARAIEKAIREKSDDGYHILPGCAGTVLEEYGLHRTMFVLAHSVKTLGPLVHACEDTQKWSWGIYTPSDDMYGRSYRADTALENLEEFIGQVREAYQALGLFGAEHCDPEAWREELRGRVLVVSPDALKESCWSQKNQLWLATGGFGCDPNASGRAIYSTCLGDGEQARWNREDFVGVLDEQYLPEWAQEKLTALRAPKQEQAAAPSMGGMEMG